MIGYIPLSWSAYVDAITLIGSERDWMFHGVDEIWQFAVTLYGGGQEWKKSLWEQYGYRGWRVGALSFGVSVSGAQRVSATGHAAHVLATRFAGFDLRCARIALQVTARFAETATDIIEQTFEASKTHHAGNVRVRPRATLVDGAGYGNTCYIGARGQEKFVRVYDKGAQSGQEQYQQHVRFECELSGSEAARCWRDGSDAQFGALWIAGRVNSLLNWGGCVGLGGLGSIGASEHSGDDSASDAKRKLAWLKRQVRPSVEWLLTAVPRDDILRALGLVDDCEVAQNFELEV